MWTPSRINRMRMPFLRLTMMSLPSALACLGQGSFSSTDIGSPNPPGQTVAVANGFDVSSATGDVWGYFDDFRFVYQRVTGDFDLRVRGTSLAGVAYWTKAGLMVRSDLTDYAMNGFVIATRSGGWGRYFFTGRLGDFYASHSYFQGSYERVQYPNVWLRLVRVGNDIIPQHSTNAVNWTQIGNLDFVTWPRSVFVGMAVSNHPDSGQTKATAQFRDLFLDLGVPGAPVILTQPASHTVNPGTGVTLSLTAVGRGSLTHQWYRDGTPIEGATNAVYSLAAVGKSDEAKFTCRVQNDDGSLWSWAAQLEVAEAEQPFDGIVSELFSRVYGSQIAYLFNATNFPNGPLSVSRPARFEVPSSGEDTGGRLRGFLAPPVTGNYTFYIAADNRGELWLSPDDNPAHKQSIAGCYYWVDPRQWAVYSDQASAPVRLEAGRRYYLEALFKGEGSPNHCAVGWQLPDGTYDRPIPLTRFRGQPATLRANGVNGDGRFEMVVDGTLHSLYVVESSANLSTWLPVCTNRVPFSFEDFTEESSPRRFYRARTSQ